MATTELAESDKDLENYQKIKLSPKASNLAENLAELSRKVKSMMSRSEERVSNGRQRAADTEEDTDDFGS